MLLYGFSMNVFPESLWTQAQQLTVMRRRSRRNVVDEPRRGRRMTSRGFRHSTPGGRAASGDATLFSSMPAQVVLQVPGGYQRRS